MPENFFQLDMILPFILPFALLGMFGGLLSFLLKPKFTLMNLLTSLVFAAFSGVLVGVFMTGKHFESYLIFVTVALSGLAAEKSIRAAQRAIEVKVANASKKVCDDVFTDLTDLTDSAEDDEKK